MVPENFRIEIEIVRLCVNSVKRLNRNLHQLLSTFHYFENSATNIVNNCTPSTRNSETLDAVNLIRSLESLAIDFHSLSNVYTLGMLGIDHCPRIFLEDEYWPR
jgi:hypothetical protein